MNVAVPGHLERLRWTRQQIERHQLEQLRRLLRSAIAGSPFHTERLRDVDPERFELADLAALPTMTKSEMMERLDDVFVDRRLDRKHVERHVAGTEDVPTYLLDEYLVLASGGSSGERGLFVFDRPAAVDYTLGLIRAGIARLLAAVGPPPGRATMALVAAGSAIHATRALPVIFGGGMMAITSIPVTQPLPGIVERLNELQPMLLQGYPSVLGLLAEEQLAGRLRIAPRTVSGGSEQFLARTWAQVGAAFGVPVVDQFGSTEGVLGASAPGTREIVLATDLAIVELVDDDNRPVEPGTPSAKVLVTNLFNRTQPLIRYELADRFVAAPASSEDGHLRVTVEGRQDEMFRWGRTVVHPLVIRSALLDYSVIVEYQVHQLDDGVEIAVVGADAIDESAVAESVGRALGAAGVHTPRVVVHRVGAVTRHPLTGKLTRFVPLAADASGQPSSVSA
jgi:phenylacetate-coenzyme A ligase PaaK-like adenylate-forming protein